MRRFFRSVLTERFFNLLCKIIYARIETLMFGKIIKYPIKSRRQQQFIISISATLAIAGGFLLFQSLKPALAKGEGAKIITVFENGARTSFKTNATTIGDALKEQGISFSREDNIEPRLSEQLTDSSYNVNIYRANPFIIEDGTTRRKVMTAAKTSRKIAEAAGLSLYSEDLILAQSSNKTIEDGAATVLVVKRAKEITVKLFGKTQTLRTQSNTIAEFLKEKNIKLSTQDQVSKDINSPLKTGDYFEIWRNGKQTITVEEDITFTIDKIQDASKDSSYREVREKGENGKKTVTYEVNIKNGIETERKKINEVGIKAAKKQVEVVGTKINLPAGSHEDWMAAAGISPSDYGYVNYIINRESSWRTTASNGKYFGLGQTNLAALSGACPNWQSDPVCQLRFFSGYASKHYGSWSGAYSAWKAKGWW